MNEPDRLAALAEQVTYLTSRQEIADCLARAARGTDRHDGELIVSAFHDDAVDEHGADVQGMPDFAAAVNARHAEVTRAHTHNLTTHSCEIVGDEAHAETYVLAGLALKDEETARLCGARYVDRLERREGIWKISFRRVVIDWIMAGDASSFHDPEYRQMGYPEGRWGHDDTSYERPLRFMG